jgi:hypothetical protein
MSRGSDGCGRNTGTEKSTPAEINSGAIARKPPDGDQRYPAVITRAGPQRSTSAHRYAINPITASAPRRGRLRDDRPRSTVAPGRGSDDEPATRLNATSQAARATAVPGLTDRPADHRRSTRCASQPRCLATTHGAGQCPGEGWHRARVVQHVPGRSDRRSLGGRARPDLDDRINGVRRVDSRAMPVPRSRATRASALLAVWPCPTGCSLPAVSFSTPRRLDSSTRLTVEYCRACAAGWRPAWSGPEPGRG